MVDAIIEEKPVEAATGAPVVSDPFVLDEAQLASLSPEQRASLDPILDGWKKRASEEIEKTKRTVSEESVKPYREKSEALDNLVKHPAFVQWWQSQQQQAMQGQNAATQNQISQSKPQDYATADEWSQAVVNASNGDPSKFQEIQARMFAAMATPYVQQSNARMNELATKLEMKELMEQYPDYKELDQVGLDEKGEGTSLLEFCINWAEQNRRPLEEGYQMARKWRDGMASGAKAQAMGLVKDKRDSVTAGPSTNQDTGTVIYVDTMDDLLRKSMQAELEGKKDLRFELRKK